MGATKNNVSSPRLTGEETGKGGMSCYEKETKITHLPVFPFKTVIPSQVQEIALCQIIRILSNNWPGKKCNLNSS